MKNQDRGMKKWHGFFMPEHSGELKNIWREDKKIKMPVLDEYQLQQFEEILRYSFEYQKPVEIDVYVDGFIETKQGLVRAPDRIMQNISLDEISGQMTVIHFDEIIQIKTID